eukprot:c8032_g1_i1 orf=318-551(+)
MNSSQEDQESVKVRPIEREMVEFGSSPRLCSEMHLHEHSDHYILEPSNGGPYQSLAIDRMDGELCLISELPPAMKEQ